MVVVDEISCHRQVIIRIPGCGICLIFSYLMQGMIFWVQILASTSVHKKLPPGRFKYALMGSKKDMKI